MKPETAFIDAVHDQLPHRRKFYRMKNHNQYVSGVADVWYSGKRRDLWVEYKWVSLLKSNRMVDLTITEQQLDWLDGRYEEQRSVAVIVGFNIGARKHGVVMLNRTWASNECMRDHLVERAAQPRDIALWLMDQCLVGSFEHSLIPIAV